MRVEHVTEPTAFLEGASFLLALDEARHNLAYGILATARASPEVYPELRGWIARDASGAAVGAALRTPPHNLILLRPTDALAIEALAGACDTELPGMVAAVPEVDAFAGAWSERHAVTLAIRFEQRIYRLETVLPTTAPPGHMRLASTADLDLVVERFVAFGDEVRHGTDDPSDVERLAQIVGNRLSSPEAGVALWEDDDEVVSIAGYGGPTPNGIRIGPVHTPPASRGRGYGTAVTAALSRLMLDRGHRFCFLYTDLANPTSNAMYARIGYEPVCDSREISFVTSTT